MSSRTVHCVDAVEIVCISDDDIPPQEVVAPPRLRPTFKQVEEICDFYATLRSVTSAADAKRITCKEKNLTDPEFRLRLRDDNQRR